MANTPTLSLRVPPEHHGLIRDVVARLKADTGFADVLRALLPPGAEAPPPPFVPNAFTQRIEAIEQWIAAHEAAVLRAEPALPTAVSVQAGPPEGAEAAAVPAAIEPMPAPEEPQKPGRKRPHPPTRRPQGMHLSAAAKEAAYAIMDPLIRANELSNPEIATRAGVGEKTVLERRRTLGIPAPKGPRGNHRAGDAGLTVSTTTPEPERTPLQQAEASVPAQAVAAPEQQTLPLAEPATASTTTPPTIAAPAPATDDRAEATPSPTDQPGAGAAPEAGGDAGAAVQAAPELAPDKPHRTRHALTDDQRAEVLRRYEAGERVNEIVKATGILQPNVSRIIKPVREAQAAAKDAAQ
jgi:hypothetical protein